MLPIKWPPILKLTSSLITIDNGQLIYHFMSDCIQSVLSGLLIGFKGEIAGSLGVDPKKTIQYSLRICLNDLGSMIFNHVIYI